MTRFSKASKAAACAILVAGGAWPALAQAQTPAAPRPETLNRLLSCRTQTDNAARLACYDAAAQAMAAAEQSGDLLVVDRGQVREAKRKSFGFDLDALNIFNRGERPEEVRDIALTLDRAYRGGDGKWVFVSREGPIWRQIDSSPVGGTPRAGDSLEISRNTLGSFFLKVGDGLAIRAARQQ